jgi:D-alanyl-D-alanine dipeptidase
MLIKKITLVFALFLLVFIMTSQKNKSTDTKKIRKGFEKLVDIQTLDSSIRVDLKYATSDNFMKKRLYFDIDKAYLQKVIAQRFVKCNTYLKKLHPNYRLLVYDAARPRSIQQSMWENLIHLQNSTHSR